ncbi:unnamed protein product [Nippostrongylus brasiliensis]|uniref:Exosome complex component RRP46 (inferred by orthology to a human protein) n=1 Tax=Nippostrongylus brasiliensis TaxID=27835 RepID=A0A0N4YS93_NIPBR|nr:unnamed protein product [Nippostrongylus brasiliensis]
MCNTGRLRVMRCELGYLHRADGSCSYSQGKTAVWASCSGPEDERLHLDVSFRQLTGDCQYHHVTVHQLQSDGSVGGAALTAVGLAVLDNGISIKAPFCGVEVCQVDGKLVLDADAKTEAKASAKWLFAFIRTAEGGAVMVASDSTGPFQVDTYASALNLARMGAEQIFSFFKEMMQRKLSVDLLPPIE